MKIKKFKQKIVVNNLMKFQKTFLNNVFFY